MARQRNMFAKECPYWPTIVTLWASGRSRAASTSRPICSETSFKEMVGLVNKPVINMESAANHPCQALADWKTLDDLTVPRRAQVRAVVGEPSARAAARGAGRHRAHGRDARHGSGGAAARRIRAARAHHAEGGAGRGRHRRLGARDRRPRRRAQRRARDLRQGMGLHRPTTATPKPTRASARHSPTGACATPGSRAPRSTANSCTACRCGVMSPSPTKCSTAAAASCSAKPTTAWSCRPRSCTACSRPRNTNY